MKRWDDAMVFTFGYRDAMCMVPIRLRNRQITLCDSEHPEEKEECRDTDYIFDGYVDEIESVLANCIRRLREGENVGEETEFALVEGNFEDVAYRNSLNVILARDIADKKGKEVIFTFKAKRTSVDYASVIKIADTVAKWVNKNDQPWASEWISDFMSEWQSYTDKKFLKGKKVRHMEMWVWLRNLLESIAENDTAKLEATLKVKPYELYVRDVNMELTKMAEVAALFKNVDVKALKAILIKYKNKFGTNLDFEWWYVHGDYRWQFVKVQMYLDILADVKKHTHMEKNDLTAKNRWDIVTEEANHRLSLKLQELFEEERMSYYKLVRKLTFDTIEAAEKAHKDDKMSAYNAALVFSRITDVWNKRLFAIKQNTMSETEISDYLERMLKANDYDLPYGFEGMYNAYFETREW